MVQHHLKFLDEIEKELCQECIPASMKELCIANSMIILLPLVAFHVSWDGLACGAHQEYLLYFEEEKLHIGHSTSDVAESGSKFGAFATCLALNNIIKAERTS